MAHSTVAGDSSISPRRNDNVLHKEHSDPSLLRCPGKPAVVLLVGEPVRRVVCHGS